MSTLAEHARLAGDLLDEHPDLPVTTIAESVDGWIDVHVASDIDVARWATAHASIVVIVAHRDIEACTQFRYRAGTIQVSGRADPRRGYRLLGDNHHVELDPREILGEVVPA